MTLLSWTPCASQVADYLAVTPSVKQVFKERCMCCNQKLITKHGRLCQECWDKAGDICAPLTEDMVWEEGRKPVPEGLVGGLCAALRASPSKTCTAFMMLVAAHLPDRAYRLTAAQATRLQVGICGSTGIMSCQQHLPICRFTC